MAVSLLWLVLGKNIQADILVFLEVQKTNFRGILNLDMMKLVSIELFSFYQKVPRTLDAFFRNI